MDSDSLDPLGISKSVNSELDKSNQDDSDGSSVDCIKEVNILPLRYSALYAEDEDKSALDKIPEISGSTVSSIPLKNAKYSARLLREGFLYILVNRFDTYKWEQAYYVNSDSLLSKIDITKPLKVSGGQRFFTLRSVEDITDSYMVFTPDPLSQKTLGKIKSSSVLRNKLQQFDIKSLCRSPVKEDVISRELIDNNVAEFLAKEDKSISDLLQKQLFPPLTDPSKEESSPVDLTIRKYIFSNIKQVLNSENGLAEGFAVVLSDPIGITQELNNFRNDALEPLKNWMEQEDENGLTNEQRFYTAELIRNLDNAYVEGQKQRSAKQKADMYKARHFSEVKTSVMKVNGEKFNGEKWSASAEDHRLFNQYESNAQQIYDAAYAGITKDQEKEYLEEYKRKYAPLIDQGARKKFDQRIDKRSKEQEALLALRAEDHIAWLTSTSFLDALDLYDNRDYVFGWAYSIQVMQATIGMDGTDKGKSLLQSWYYDINLRDRSNLVWSSYALNQTNIRVKGQEELEKFQEKDNRNCDDSDGWIGPSANKLVDGFKQISTAFNDANKAISDPSSLPSWFKKNFLNTTMTWYTQFIGGIFSKVNGGLKVSSLERKVIRSTLKLLTSQLPKQAADIGMARKWYKRGASAGKKKAQALAHASDYLEHDINQAINGSSSDFLKTRLSIISVLIESYGLCQALSKQNKNSRDYEKIAGSCVVLFGAISDTAASSVGMVVLMGKYHKTDIGDAAKFRLGGFSFWGGMLASVGAAFVAVDDAFESMHQLKNRNILLSVVYLVRFMVNIGVAVVGTALTLASSAAYLAKLASSGKTAVARTLATRLLPVARVLASTAIRGTLAAAFSILSWAVIIISIGVWFFGDDALETWCKKCVFTTESDPDFYENYAEEISGFYSALGDVS